MKFDPRPREALWVSCIPLTMALVSSIFWRANSLDGVPPLEFVVFWSLLLGPAVAAWGAMFGLVWYSCEVPGCAGLLKLLCCGCVLYWFFLFALHLMFPDPNFLPIVRRGTAEALAQHQPQAPGLKWNRR